MSAGGGAREAGGASESRGAGAAAPAAPAGAALAPMLAVRGGSRAVEFYRAAFGAVETYRVEAPDGAIVARLSIGAADLWVADEAPEHGSPSPASLGGSSVRLVLAVADPDAAFARAIAAGATVVSPVAEEHGWRLGRVVDPFGHRWEIAREV